MRRMLSFVDGLLNVLELGLLDSLCFVVLVLGIVIGSYTGSRYHHGLGLGLFTLVGLVLALYIVAVLLYVEASMREELHCVFRVMIGTACLVTALSTTFGFLEAAITAMRHLANC